MVRSGLADRIDVSQYRLALHLGLAIAIFGALVWVALSVDAREGRPAAARDARVGGAAAIMLLVFVQILLGAFVAGLKAGASYNTWPLMDGRLVPDGLGAMEPWYLNLFENALTVQFNHRLVAYALVFATLWHVWSTARHAQFQDQVHCCRIGRRRAGAGGTRHRHLAGAGAAGAGTCAPGRRGCRVRGRGVAPPRAPSSAPTDEARAMSGLVLVFDLDDTLYPERQFALSGFAAAEAGRRRS